MGNFEVAATSSDDLKVIVWQLDKRRQPLLELRTEHEIVVTQATLLDNERLATSCMDGQVRLSHLGKHQGMAQDRLLVQHRGAVYRIATPPGSPELLLSGGEDGQVPLFHFIYCSQLTVQDWMGSSKHFQVFLHDFRVPHPTKLLALRDRKDRKVQVCVQHAIFQSNSRKTCWLSRYIVWPATLWTLNSCASLAETPTSDCTT